MTSSDFVLRRHGIVGINAGCFHPVANNCLISILFPPDRPRRVLEMQQLALTTPAA